MATSLITFFTLFLFLATSQGLKCYVCSLSDNALCLSSPSSVPGTPSVECNLRYCTIRRQEYQNPQGKIASFHRGCESNPVHLNTMVDSGDFRTYYRACSSDLCNTGNGIQPVNVNAGNSNVGSLMVPGTGQSSSHTVLPRVTLLCLAVLITTLLYTTQ